MGGGALKNRWTIAGEAVPGEEFDEIARAIRDEIDREILSEVRRVHLANRGYHEVRCRDPGTNGDLVAWLQTNVCGSYEVLTGCVMLERTEDAVAFSMVWT